MPVASVTAVTKVRISHPSQRGCRIPIDRVLRLDTPVERARVNVEVWAGYENRWDLMGESAYVAPVLLPGWVRELAQDKRVGLPPGHTWETELPV